MQRIEENEGREHRIDMEIVVDAYNEVERAMGWYYYLEYKLDFPFRARCTVKRDTSPLAVGEEVQVEGMPSEDECFHEMLVKVCWLGRELAVPLSQLEGIDVDSETQEAIEDWHYWVARGYQL